MDTLIFALTLSTLAAMALRRRGIALGLYFLTLAATVWLFWHHVTDSLKLNF